MQSNSCFYCFTTYLGLEIDENFKLKHHAEYVLHKLSKSLFLMRRLSHFCLKYILPKVYYALFDSILKYGMSIWGRTSSLKTLFILQKVAIRKKSN